jgi:hypothetical protein
VEHLTKDDLERLTEERAGPCVSIFMPTHRAGTETRQDPIRLKNLLSRAREQLVDGGLRSTEADGLLEPARELLEDEEFWRHQADGLALFLSPDSFQRYRLPLPFDELVVVIADRYHVKPLLPLLAEDGEFYVLALSQNDVRFLRATRHGVEEADLGDAPRSLAEALKFDDPEKQLQFHTGTGGGAGGRPAVFHGHDPQGDAKQDLLRFFRQVDAGVTEELKGRLAPLVLAGVDYLLPIYREASSYPHVLEGGIEGNPEGLRPEELRDRAWEVVEPQFAQARLEALDRYGQLAGTGQTSTDLAEVVAAAYYGRVETLFVAAGSRRWGSFDPGSGTVHEHGEPEAGDGDLLDFAAVQTFLNGGTVHVLDPDEMPAGEVAAVFRY